MWLVDHRCAICQEKRETRANLLIKEPSDNDNDDDIYPLSHVSVTYSSLFQSDNWAT